MESMCIYILLFGMTGHGTMNYTFTVCEEKEKEEKSFGILVFPYVSVVSQHVYVCARVRVCVCLG